ncbi:hypothetical protein BDN72DRAFT_836691 [Pluteus cervinus]|uniref:Uncharacterized protein n=1 Tax=Pluteus cervinus TaxID=181527 RepID=A0ACD3B385_9AGAR|nr:hypothetical protein BDN72DRAFT_836691 [Pluteus cervinus]
MTTQLQSRCHCGKSVFTVAFRTESLPISNDYCHCTTCRHATGELALNQGPIQGVPLTKEGDKPVDLTTTLTAYNSSEWATRYFCTTCSAHMIFHDHRRPSWAIAVSTLERVTGVVDIGFHMFVLDTKDGGLADHFPFYKGVELPRYAGLPGSQTLARGWHLANQTEGVDQARASQENLAGYCHCKAISFTISRPSTPSESPRLRASYPDLLHPHHSTSPEVLRNPNEEQWWIRGDGTKYLAGYCACSGCCLSSGSDVMGWAFVPRCNVTWTTQVPASATCFDLQDTSSRPKELKQYCPSEDTRHEFCGTCGATAFFWKSTEPDILQVAVGLLDADVGVRAETWLDWHRERVGYEEEATNVAVVEGIKARRAGIM